ncbi:MAG: glutamate ligase domain-containing protein, partial [Dehalococcoidia bacterium]
IGEGAPLRLSLQCPGAHNKRNAALALACIEALDLDPRRGEAELLSFAGLPYRLQLIGSFHLRRGITIRGYDDSKSTTPEAASLGIDAFSVEQGEVGPQRVHLICGGYDKGVDLEPLAAAAARCAGVYAIGATGMWITRRVQEHGGRSRWCETLGRAVRAAVDDAGDGDVILLSPGCASWDQFRSYEERGQEFDQLMRQHLPSTGGIEAAIGTRGIRKGLPERT